jgi:hypothetical protein
MVEDLDLRTRFLGTTVVPAPMPWRPADCHVVRVGGLIGVGFARHPETGRDLLLTASHNGLGLVDASTGERLARDDDDDLAWPDDDDLTCPGIGPITGTRVRMAGLPGGGLHAGTTDGWSVHVVCPDWPDDQVLLSSDGNPYTGGAHGETWWHIHHANVTELRAAGFSPSGASLIVATSSDVTLWTRS